MVCQTVRFRIGSNVGKDILSISLARETRYLTAEQAGAGFGGLTVPFLMAWGLKRFGHSVVLQAWAVTLVGHLPD